jgi:hypothetical protein
LSLEPARLRLLALEDVGEALAAPVVAGGAADLDAVAQES